MLRTFQAKVAKKKIQELSVTTPKLDVLVKKHK